MHKLDLSHRKIHDDKLKQLIDYNLNRYDWSNLKELNLEKNIIGEPGFLVLFGKRGIKGCHLTNLNILKLGENQIDTGIQYFALVEQWDNLKKLYLNRNFISGTVVFNTRFSVLEVLDLSFNGIGDRGVNSLLVNGQFPNLRKLNLMSTSMSSEGLRSISENCHKIRHLKILNIGCNLLYDDGFEYLSTIELALEKLLCSDVRMGDNGVRFLVRGGSLLSLTSLDLSKNSIEDDGLQILSHGIFINLKTLSLEGNKIGNEGMLYLSSSEVKLPNLTKLNLDNNIIGVEGAEHLAKSTNLTQMEHLDCNNNNASLNHKNFESSSISNFMEDCGENLEQVTEPFEYDFDGNMLNMRGEEIMAPSHIVSFSWVRNTDYSYVY